VIGFLARRRALGPRGERVAARRLKREGYRLLARNWRDRSGELDLVLEDPDGRTVVVVEVKSRLKSGGPPPEASVTRDKTRRLIALTQRLRRANGWTDRPVRIDVVGVEFDRRGRVVGYRHNANAVNASGRPG